MTIKEQRTKLILQETKSNQSSNISKGIQPCLTWPRETRGVESSFARLIKQRGILVPKIKLNFLMRLTNSDRSGGYGSFGRNDGG